EDARDLATQVLPPNVTEVASDADGVTASATLLGAVLLDHDPAVEKGDRTTVLTAYTEQKLIETDGAITEPAQGMIIVTSLPFTERDASERNAAVLTSIKQFAAAGPVVLAAPGTGGDANPVVAVRDD